MYKLPTFVVLCSLAVSMCVPVENSVNIEVFADKSEILAKYPDAIPMNEEIIAVDGARGSKLYTYGQRQSGDVLVDSPSDFFTSPFPMDMSLAASHPKKGLPGYPVTYVNILAVHDGAGSAMIIGGGIGQKQMHVLISATSTYTLSFAAQFYGFKNVSTIYS